MSQAMQRAEVNVMQSEKMICVECFRTKGDRDSRQPCQNPRCHFYLCTPIIVSSSRTQDFFQTDISESFKFNKEVGYDRKSKPRPHTSDNLPNQVLCKDNMWGSQPMGPACRKVPQMTMQKSRSKSVSTASTGGGVRIRRLLSGGYQAPVVTDREGDTKSRLFHSRIMSMPEYTDSLMIHEGVGDLVEDAFVSSPLADYGVRVDIDKRRFGTPDTDIDIDSGISSPFGRPSNVLDWLDSSKSQSTSVTSSVPVVSSASATTSSFDMTQLKMEMTKAIDSQMEQSLAVNGRGSPESLDVSQLPINNVATVLGLGGLIHCSETYSRKIFIGGLPPDIDEDDIKIFFMRFGSLTVDWPHKSHSKACIPPKGYAFLLFKNESSVHKLLLSCISEGSKHFIYMPSSNLIKKKVQIRPWYIADSYHSVDASKPIDPRKAVFVGGVPRPLRASELAEVMTKKYGNIAFIVIDSDSDLKYPKGAACVVFSSHASYIAAVSARFMQLNHGSLDKKIEIKPYVLDGQMCDECNGVQCNGKPAPFFCGSVTCLQYYCEHCWATAHSMPGRQNHRPLLKDIGDKARFY